VADPIYPKMTVVGCGLIGGSIVRAARAAGVAVPVTETLWRLVKLEEAKLLG
jgi:prephenate dehydrogenase